MANQARFRSMHANSLQDIIVRRGEKAMVNLPPEIELPVP
jgi:hypothetical protein